MHIIFTSNNSFHGATIAFACYARCVGCYQQWWSHNTTLLKAEIIGNVWDPEVTPSWRFFQIETQVPCKAVFAPKDGQLFDALIARLVGLVCEHMHNTLAVSRSTQHGKELVAFREGRCFLFPSSLRFQAIFNYGDCYWIRDLPPNFAPRLDTAHCTSHRSHE